MRPDPFDFLRGQHREKSRRAGHDRRDQRPGIAPATPPAAPLANPTPTLYTVVVHGCGMAGDAPKVIDVESMLIDAPGGSGMLASVGWSSTLPLAAIKPLACWKNFSAPLGPVRLVSTWDKRAKKCQHDGHEDATTARKRGLDDAPRKRFSVVVSGVVNMLFCRRRETRGLPTSTLASRPNHYAGDGLFHFKPFAGLGIVQRAVELAGELHHRFQVLAPQGGEVDAQETGPRRDFDHVFR